MSNRPRRLERSALVLCALGLCLATAVAADRDVQFQNYSKGIANDVLDKALRSKFDDQGITMTYEAYTEYKESANKIPMKESENKKDQYENSDKSKFKMFDFDQNGFHDNKIAGMGDIFGKSPDFLGSFAENPAFLAPFVDVSRPVPVVHIVVTPSPPMDYAIAINGRSYAATSRSLYAVSGTISIVVTRPGKQACLWAGAPVAGSNQDIVCPL